MPKFKIKLTTESIDKAIREIKAYQKGWREADQKWMNGLLERGIEIAREELKSMISPNQYRTYDIENNIVGYIREDGVGVIRAAAPYAAFVEFGTGIVGADHPDPQGWQRDASGHGDNGWVYYNERDDRYHWTMGMPSRPFMYNTAVRLAQEIGLHAEVIFNRDRY